MDHRFIRNRLGIHKPNTEIVRGDNNLNSGMDPDGQLTAAAVLVPLVLHDEGITALFTQRTKRTTKPSGQISFPGGPVEDVDINAEATALRETKEEVGIDGAHIEITGRLDCYGTRTGSLVTPVVGLLIPPFNITLDDPEVDEVSEVTRD